MGTFLILACATSRPSPSCILHILHRLNRGGAAVDGDTMADTDGNRRDSGRFDANFECICAGTNQRGMGTLEDISRTGALIENTRVIPDRGEVVGLSLDLAGFGCIVLIGHMVRRTITGFAIEFDHLDTDAELFIDNVASLVKSRRS